MYWCLDTIRSIISANVLKRPSDNLPPNTARTTNQISYIFACFPALRQDAESDLLDSRCHIMPFVTRDRTIDRRHLFRKMHVFRNKSPKFRTLFPKCRDFGNKRYLPGVADAAGNVIIVSIIPKFIYIHLPLFLLLNKQCLYCTIQILLLYLRKGEIWSL